jgi:ferric-dicitrate binding protein FerR (iron transport regulator)
MNMKENQEHNLDRFIDSLRSGDLEHQDVREMEELLKSDPELRRRYRARMRMESNLLSVCQSEQAVISPPAVTGVANPQSKRWWYLAAGAGIAATVMFSVLMFYNNATSTPSQAVARIETQSQASWAGTLPLTENAELGPGEIDLRTGVAEIRFVSGVLLSLEAPARLKLIDPMRCRLLTGSVVVDVPDGAEGFTIDTPKGHVVDHGTSFAVTVDNESATSEFGVISGKISVHHSGTGGEKTLVTGEAVRLTSAGMVALEMPFAKKTANRTDQNFRRLKTKGRETSIVRNDQRELMLSPDLLMVKTDKPMRNESRLPVELMPKDRRSLIGFNLDGVDNGRIRSAKLRMNLVPSGLGFVSFLPNSCSFEIYGIKDDASLESWWSGSLNWKDAPGSLAKGNGIDHSEVELLATFEIPKGLQEGPITIETDDLIEYLKRDTTGEVGFLVVTTTVPKRTWSLVHAFASSEHRDAAGPTLEVELEGE